MTQQHPQQPYPPQPPGWTPPPPPKKNVGKIVGLGCTGIIGLIIVIAIIGAIATSSSDSSNEGSTSVKPTATAPKSEQPPADSKTSPPAKSDTKTEAPKKKVVTFKVWGTAPAGALGPLDITYGSDSDTRKGTFKNGTFEATLPLDEDAMYFNVMAQLQGSGDINCSVTVDGHTEKGHASGGYNICNAQANAGLLGGWG